MGEADAVPEADPTVSVSVSFHASVVESVRERVGKRGVSPYVEAAVRRQIERDNLAALIRASEEIHGPLTAGEIQAARMEMLGLGADGEVA